MEYYLNSDERRTISWSDDSDFEIIKTKRNPKDRMTLDECLYFRDGHPLSINFDNSKSINPIKNYPYSVADF